MSYTPTYVFVGSQGLPDAPSPAHTIWRWDARNHVFHPSGSADRKPLCAGGRHMNRPVMTTWTRLCWLAGLPGRDTKFPAIDRIQPGWRIGPTLPLKSLRLVGLP